MMTAWGSGEGKFKSCSSSAGGAGGGREGGRKGSSSGFLNRSCRSRRRPGPVCTDGQACLPCRTPVWGWCRDLLHPVSWGPCRLPRKLSAFTEGPGLEETLLPLSPAAPGHFLAWLPALLNTRPGFPSSVKASGSPAPRRSLQPRV